MAKFGRAVRHNDPLFRNIAVLDRAWGGRQSPFLFANQTFPTRRRCLWRWPQGPERADRGAMKIVDPLMTDAEYFEALRAASEDGDQQAEAVLRLLQSRGILPLQPPPSP